MLAQLKKLFGGSKRTSSNSSADAPGPRSGFKPMPLQSSEPRRIETAPPVTPAPEVVDEDVSLPLQSVLNALPPDLKSRVVPMDLGGATLTLGLHKILSQLPSGAVTLSFGVLRSAAPQLFSLGGEFDERDIELPLNEILVRINPALLPPTADQKPLLTDATQDSFIVAATPSGAQPVTRQASSGRIRVPFPSIASAPKASVATNSPPAAVAAKQSPASPDRESIIISLTALAATWPSEVRSEIAQLNCKGSQVALPEPLVKLGMKQGKVAFPWQVIRGWIHPAPPSVVSKHDRTMLNLPLELLMPLFISRLKQSSTPRSRVVVDESIPPLFNPTTSAEAPATNGVETANPPAESTSPSPSKPKTPGTDFKNRYLSPTEVVSRASALEGVAGALVVLPEGLLVAARLSTNQNPDALAAFSARALGRINECAEEAQIGELSQMEFTALGTPWKIFRLHGVLFAAFGHADGMLPITELAAIAGEFERKKRG